MQNHYDTLDTVLCHSSIYKFNIHSLIKRPMFEAVKKLFYAHLLPSISEVQILLYGATVLNMISYLAFFWSILSVWFLSYNILLFFAEKSCCRKGWDKKRNFLPQDFVK